MASPTEWTPEVGAAVYDRGTGLPWKIKHLDGRRVTLVRPSGFEVVANRLSLRPATPWQKRQLKALANFHKQREIAAQVQRHMGGSPVILQNSHEECNGPKVPLPGGGWRCSCGAVFL
ncbi:hypothetical protein GCM10012286_48220 [Streptomyces lasiicapitis]|uniref:Uncharacterized protein n=1 Tax=Streptomyces lasiicapitis TaxID=1923961 RepID=A0ABQ2MD21_9ACTN|nr:hypothetical protein GCM10012286_48220 [Streptomyces lasiicapitis]